MHFILDVLYYLKCKKVDQQVINQIGACHSNSYVSKREVIVFEFDMDEEIISKAELLDLDLDSKS